MYLGMCASGLEYNNQNLKFKWGRNLKGITLFQSLSRCFRHIYQFCEFSQMSPITYYEYKNEHM